MDREVEEMTAEILALIIFIVMFVLIIMDKIERHIVSLSCGLLMLVLVFGICMHSGSAIWETLNIGSIFTPGFWYTAGASEESSAGINWSTIVFILGMMVMVEGMGRAGFFRWLCLEIASLVKYRTIPVFITFMIMSFVLSMFIDSITVILFLAAVTLELAQILKCEPLPIILAEIFCANLGGSATMSGDPPNIIIGTSLGFSFMDFVTNTGMISLLALVVTIVYFYLCYRKVLAQPASAVPVSYPDPKEAITDKGEFVKSCVIFAIAVALLVTHAQTGLTVACIGVIVMVLVLLTQYKEAGELMKNVDYKTLLFFIGLFVVVGGLEKTGVLEAIAALISRLSGSNGMIMAAIILWISAFASAFIDNIPFAATMIPVIKSLAVMQGVDITTLAWALSLGTDIGGSATPIGASANVVGISVASKQGYHVGWGWYCRYAAPATILVVLLSTVMIYVRYF